MMIVVVYEDPSVIHLNSTTLYCQLHCAEKQDLWVTIKNREFSQTKSFNYYNIIITKWLFHRKKLFYREKKRIALYSSAHTLSGVYG